MSFISDKIHYEGITFDDVLLLPSFSKVLPRDVNTSTYFTRNIKLNTPIVSAAMDTVTEAKLAIAIAREGGIGVIHKNMSITDQVLEVKKVKRAENVMITNPITVEINAVVKDVLDLMDEYKIGGIPVIDENEILIGIITNRDLRFEHNPNLPVKEIMTSENLITAAEDTDLLKASSILRNHKIEKLPIVDANYKLKGLITFKDITTAKDRPNSCKDNMGRLRVAAGIGVTFDSMERVEALVKGDVDAVVIDTAHGHSAGVIEMAKNVKKKYPDLELVVGNIGTAEAAKARMLLK
jgi:IMP dehydrogenase